MEEVTVVVPTHNGERTLPATLDSLHLQTVPVRVIVVDDESTDASAALAHAHPVVDRVFSEKRRGVAAARNKGVAVASTKYVAFLDQDDLWHPTRTELLLQTLRESGCSAAATTEQAFAVRSDETELRSTGDQRIGFVTQWIDAGAERAMLAASVPCSGEVELIGLDQLMGGAISVTTSALYDREAVVVAGGCAPFIRAADDHVLNVNFVNLFGPIARIDCPNLFYRVHPAATSNSSPMGLPFLTLQLALRYGRALPSGAVHTPNIDHLLWQVAEESSLSRAEQLALITLSTARTTRRRWIARWLKRAMRGTIPRD